MKAGYKLLIIVLVIIAALFVFNAVYGFPGTNDPQVTQEQQAE